jgi:hypothetical protein
LSISFKDELQQTIGWSVCPGQIPKLGWLTGRSVGQRKSLIANRHPNV